MNLRAVSIFIFLLACWITIPAPVNAATAVQKAETLVKSVGDTALALLAQYNETRDLKFRTGLKRLIQKNFDLEGGTRFVLGRHWRDSTEQQRSELLSLLPEYALEIAARSFLTLKSRDIREFSVVGTNSIGETDLLVKTSIRVRDAQPLVLGWRVHNESNHLKIVDATVEGVSMAVTLRDVIDSEISRKGIDGLIADVRIKLAELQSEK